jgi:transposase-like protein
MYARGMSDRKIQEHLEEIYNVEVSPDLISRVTNAVLDEVREWQNRPLDKSYAVVYSYPKDTRTRYGLKAGKT